MPGSIANVDVVWNHSFLPAMKPGLASGARAVGVCMDSPHGHSCSCWGAEEQKQGARRPPHQEPSPNFSGTSRNRGWNRALEEISCTGESHTTGPSLCHAAELVPLSWELRTEVP